MFEIVKNFLEGFRNSQELKLREQKAVKRILESIGELVMERSDDDGFNRVGVYPGMKGHTEADQYEMIKRAREYFRWDPHGRAAIQTMVNFMFGRGFSINVKSKNPLVRWQFREFWSSKRNNMDLRKFEIGQRAFRDGEVFIEFFSADEAGNETGKTTIRFIDPLLVKNPSAGSLSYDLNNTKNGIETDPNDVEKPLRYFVQDPQNQTTFRVIEADKMHHIKLFADSDQTRGESWIQPVMKFFRYYKEWLEDRIILNKLRSAIVLIRKVSGPSGDISRIAGNLSAASNQRAGESKVQSIKRGTILTANAGVDYKMESANINATDVKEDGRNIKLSIAAGTNLPEYIFGDASNANFSSTLVAESPFVKAVQYWQIFFEYHFACIVYKVIEAGVRAGTLTPPSDDEFYRKLKKLGDLVEAGESEDPDKYAEAEAELFPEGSIETPSEIFYGADLQWPEIIHRDLKIQTDSLTVMRQNGWIADPTASAALGYDYTEEVRKQQEVEEKAQENGNSLLGIKAGETPDQPSEMDNEVQNVLQNMDQNELKDMIKSGDPAQIAQMLMAKMKQNGKTKEPAPAGNDN